MQQGAQDQIALTSLLRLTVILSLIVLSLLLSLSLKVTRVHSFSHSDTHIVHLHMQMPNMTLYKKHEATLDQRKESAMNVNTTSSLEKTGMAPSDGQSIKNQAMKQINIKSTSSSSAASLSSRRLIEMEKTHSAHK